MEFSGRLASFPPAELLQWAHNERRTGSLVVRRSRRQKRIYFRGGEIVGCLSDDPAEFYGQHLLLFGHLEEQILLETLSHCARKNQRLGAALVEMGHLTAEQARATLRRQIEDLVCDLFLWKHGVFYFELEAAPEEELLPEPVHTLGLVMEGTRWVDEYHRVRRVLVHDNIVLRRGAGWPGQEAKFTAPQRRVVAKVDGERTLAQIYKLIRGSYFRVVEAAYKLCINEVLDIGQVGEASESTSMEISVYDLLLEQAMEEQGATLNQPGLPLEVLQRFYPVWVREPLAEEGEEAPEARAFYQQLDGSRTLAEVLPAEGAARLRDLDLFLLQLRKGNLALLPAPPDSLAEAVEVPAGHPLRQLLGKILR